MLMSRVKEVQQHYILRECCQGGSCVGGWVGTGGDFQIKARCHITMHGVPKLGRPPTKPPLTLWGREHEFVSFTSITRYLHCVQPQLSRLTS